MGWCHQRNCQCGLQGTEKVGQNERKLPDFLGCTGLSHLLSPLWTCRVLQEKGGRTPKLIQRSSKLPSLPWPWGKRISILVSEGRATTKSYRVTLPPRAREEGHWAQEGYSQSFRSTGICLAGFWVRLGPITCFFFLSFAIRRSILYLPHHCTLKAQNLSVFTGSQLERTYHWGWIVLWVSSILIQIIGGARLVTKLCLTLATPWTVAWKIPLSMGFSRQVYWSGLPFTSLGIFQTQELNPGLLHCRQILYRLSYKGSPSFRSYLFFLLGRRLLFNIV